VAIEEFAQRRSDCHLPLEFWKFDSIKSSMIAIKLFDIAVNMGPFAAALIVQKALAFCGVAIKVDGRYGPATEIAINHTPELKLFQGNGAVPSLEVCVDCVCEPSQLDFIDGWTARAAKRPSV